MIDLIQMTSFFSRYEMGFARVFINRHSDHLPFIKTLLNGNGKQFTADRYSYDICCVKCQIGIYIEVTIRTLLSLVVLVVLGFFQI